MATLTSNSGGPVPPIANNINLLGGNNITGTGNPGTATITFDLTGTTIHDVQIGNASGSLTSVPNGTTGQVLLANTGADPSWGSVPTAGFVTSVVGGNNITITGTASVPIVNVSGTTNHSLLLGNSTGSLNSLGVGTNGQLPIGSTAADPVLTTLTPGTGISISKWCWFNYNFGYWNHYINLYFSNHFTLCSFSDR